MFSDLRGFPFFEFFSFFSRDFVVLVGIKIFIISLISPVFSKKGKEGQGCEL